MLVPDDAGMPRDVVLGWDDRTQYCSNPSHTYFGATIGRVANRITNGSFTLDGKVRQTLQVACRHRYRWLRTPGRANVSPSLPRVSPCPPDTARRCLPHCVSR